MTKASNYLLLVTVFSAVVARQAFAYNDVACAHWRNRLSRERSFPTSISTSTSKYGTSFSQFTTSWGHCSGLALREQRQDFIAENSDELTLQTAQGQGETLDALAQLSGCETPVGHTQFKRVMQKNFATLYFKNGKPADVPQITEGIDRLIQATPELTVACLSQPKF